MTARRESRQEPDTPSTGGQASPDGLDQWLSRVGSGDLEAFDQVYKAVASAVFGIASRVLRDPDLAQEVAQEAIVEVWRNAARFDPARGSARAWVATIAHRQAVDRVRAEQAGREREAKAAARDSDGSAFDQVAESVAVWLEQQEVRLCLDGLTELQRLLVSSGCQHARSAGRHRQDPTARRVGQIARLPGSRTVSAVEPETHALIGAYVCDALDPAEQAAFERHLLECAACRREVDELREVTGALAEAAAIEPPEGLRAAVDAKIAVTRQLPADVTSVVTPIAIPRRRQPSARLAWAGWAAAAVLAGVVAVLSVVASGQSGRIDAVTAQASSLSALLSAPDVRSDAARVDTGGLATVVASRSRDEAAITLSGLAGLPAGKVYQLWIVAPEGMRSAGLVPLAAGVSSPIFARGLGDAQALALSIEPAGGSARPTTAPILTVAIPG